jgi:phospholipid/cholesterol/gamma-HCH transport system ATP-binding protein
MDTIVAEIKHLKKSFGKSDILKDINFKLNAGENLTILGQSGSGKSVLIKCMVGLIEPDGGEINLLGQDVWKLKTDQLNELRSKIGFLFQSAALYDSMTVKENLAFHLRNNRELTKLEINDLVNDALQNVGLIDAIDKMPSELSGGMKKRIALARAIIQKPQIIFYDEPTTGLDPFTSKEISSLILMVQKKFNTASIIITHDIDCAKITSNRMIILKEGLIEQEGTSQELSKSEDKWIKSFFY